MDESVSDEIKILEAEAAELAAERAEMEARVRELREKENIPAGIVYSKEIYEAQQNKLRLDVDIQFRRNKINRLKGGF